MKKLLALLAIAALATGCATPTPYSIHNEKGGDAKLVIERPKMFFGGGVTEFVKIGDNVQLLPNGGVAEFSVAPGRHALTWGTVGLGSIKGKDFAGHPIMTGLLQLEDGHTLVLEKRAPSMGPILAGAIIGGVAGGVIGNGTGYQSAFVAAGAAAGMAGGIEAAKESMVAGQAVMSGPNVSIMVKDYK